MNDKNQVKCPHCAEMIDVTNVMTHQIEEKFKAKYKDELLSINKKRADIENEVNTKVSQKLEKAKNQLVSEEAKKHQDRLLFLENEVKEKSLLKKKAIELESKLLKLKDEAENYNAAKDLDIQRAISETKKSLKSDLEAKHELDIKEYQKQLEDTKKDMINMKRKLEQGSVQLQGEVQELSIEQWLDDTYKKDVITEIKKGVNGADCLQKVFDDIFNECGSIYYESKSTKEFNHSWISKMKDDMANMGVDIGVIVTQTMPKNTERACLIDGVWVCSFLEYKILSRALREGLIRTANSIVAQTNKGDKSIMLYDYLTGPEFKRNLENVLSVFVDMKSQIDKERRSMNTHWKKREKQLEKSMNSLSNICGSFQGIAGSEIQNIDVLELPTSDEQ